MNFRNMPFSRKLGLAAGVAAAIALLCLTLGSMLVISRTRATVVAVSEKALENASLVAESTINRQLLQVDGALAGLPALLSATAAGSSDGRITQQTAIRVLSAFYFENFAFRDMLLVRPGGDVWASARWRPEHQPLPFQLSETEVSANPGAVSVQGPVRNASTGSWSWFLVRSVNLPQVGQMFATAEVPVSFLTELLSPLSDITGLQIRLERPDGTLLASLPHDELTMGHRSREAGTGAAPENIVRQLTEGTGRSPTLAIWRHTLYPAVNVAARLDLTAADAEWKRDRNRMVAVAAAAALLIVGAAVSLYLVLRQRERVEIERRRSREMLESAIEAMQDGFVMWDEDDRLVACNERFRDMYRFSAAALQPGAQFEDIIRYGALNGQYPQRGNDLEQFVQDTVAWHKTATAPLERLLPDGRWLMIKEQRIPSGGTVGIRTDVTEMKQATSELALANERVNQIVNELKQQNDALMESDAALRKQNMLFDAALNNMSQGLLMVDAGNRLIVCNQQFLDLFRITAAEARAGTQVSAIFRAVLANGGLSQDCIKSLMEHQRWIAESHRPEDFVCKDGNRMALAVSQRSLVDGGWVATYEDVTEHKLTEERIWKMAHHDALTSLPNRLLFRMRMDEALHAVVESGERVALLCLDLDRFKYVNDTMGHPAGDSLLISAARRLERCLRPNDIVARLGGDEFAALVVAEDLPATAIEVAQRMIAALSAPYTIEGRQLQVGASVGIALSPESGMDGDTLLKNADVALYQAKAQNPGTYCVFQHEMQELLCRRVAVETDLRVALTQKQFEIFYQPVFYLDTHSIWGFEALVRWSHPERGIIPPAEFISLAEELGTIKQIGAWVLRQVCMDAAGMPHRLRVAANLSACQLEDASIVDTVTQALNDAGLDPSRLELEITESALLNNNAATRGVLLALRDLGLSIALDDFGTGYSSLSYLRAFPFNKIKIDRLFVSEMSTRPECAAIVSSIVELARTLGMTTTAEGIETRTQLELVTEVGCTTAQGYLLGKPERLGNWLSDTDFAMPLGLAISELERSGAKAT